MLLFVLFALSRAVLRFKGRQITLSEFLFWALVWIVVGVLIIIPDTTNALARLFGVGRGVDAIIYISIALLFYLVFRIYVKLENVEQEITKVVREVSLNKGKRGKK
ncbi:DUF2304 domain-containing protein [candidate division KSB1 bacterium]